MAQADNSDTDFDDPAHEPLLPGHKLMQGQFTIEKFLNSGGFGITYVARDSLDRQVVIKECYPDAFCRRSNTSVRARSRSLSKEFSSIVKKFVDEANSLAKMKHPNIVGVHQIFEENNTAYMVMDLIEGNDFHDIIEGQAEAPAPAEIEEILVKLLGAIGSIHDQDMLHRDISPDNILLRTKTDPVLIDFGAVREDAGKEGRAKSELRVIKDGYSPHEFYVSGAEQGPYSDLYALGATFYHVITKERPTNAQARLAAVAEGRQDPYQPLSGRFPDYSAGFLRGIDSALNILPRDRIRSAADWLELLNEPDATGGTKPTFAVINKASQTHQSGTANKSKARILAGVGLAVPVIASVLFMQSGTGAETQKETSSALATADIAFGTSDTPPVNTALGLPTTEPEAADLSAALGLPTTEPEPTDLSAALGLTNTEPEPADLSAALGLTTTEPEPTDLSSALGLPNAEPEPADLSAALGLPTTEPEPADLSDNSGPIQQASLTTEDRVDLPVEPLPSVPSHAVNTVIEQPAAPDSHETSLPDGTAFEARVVDGTWTTVVIDVPPVSEFAISDVVVGDAETQMPFDQKTSLSDAIVEASAQNRVWMTLAVRRDGILVPVSIRIPRS